MSNSIVFICNLWTSFYIFEIIALLICLIYEELLTVYYWENNEEKMSISVHYRRKLIPTILDLKLVESLIVGPVGMEGLFYLMVWIAFGEKIIQVLFPFSNWIFLINL